MRLCESFARDGSQAQESPANRAGDRGKPTTQVFGQATTAADAVPAVLRPEASSCALPADNSLLHVDEATPQGAQHSGQRATAPGYDKLADPAAPGLVDAATLPRRPLSAAEGVAIAGTRQQCAVHLG